MNPEAASFQRQFVSDVRRCEEIERQLRYVECEVAKEDIAVTNCSYDEVDAPAPREILQIESDIAATEESIKQSGDNLATLM